MHRTLRKAMVALVAVVAFAGLAVPASASAASTTVTPAGDSLALGAATVRIDVPTAAIIGRCTISGGTAKIPAAPANHTASGPVTIKFTENPKFTSCMWGYGFGEEGSFEFSSLVVGAPELWSLSLQSGAPATAKVNVPAGGLRVGYGNCEAKSSSQAASLGGNWTNGTASPFAASKMGLSGSVKFPWSGTCGWTETAQVVQVSAPTVNVTDTTNSSKVIQVGS